MKRISKKDIGKEYEKINQEISINYICSLAADFSKNIKPKDSELKNYFARNKELFRQYIPANRDENNRNLFKLDGVEQKVREAFINTEALKLAEQKINECAKELETREFKQAAKKCDLKVKETAPFKFGSDVEGIGATNIFWNTAKLLNDKEHSKIIRIPSGFYIIQVKSITQIDKNKFDQDRIEFGKNLIEQKKQERFSAFLMDLNKKAALY